MSVIARARSAREATVSICAHTWARPTGSNAMPSCSARAATSSPAAVISSSTFTAAAIVIEARPSLGKARIFCLADSRSARANSLLVISTSSRSSASSTARVCR